MISKEQLTELAELARLELSDAEAQGLVMDISSILDYVGQLAAVEGGADVQKKVPQTVMREDTPRDAGDAFAGKEETLRSAFPRREGDFAVVRRILQKDE